jgi:hypothetical protein
MMTRTRKPKKVFVPEQDVEVQRGVGLPWEPATYIKGYPDWRGWHCVRLEQPRYIHTMSGMEIDRATDHAGRGILTHQLSVPTQRVRAVRT